MNKQLVDAVFAQYGNLTKAENNGNLTELATSVEAILASAEPVLNQQKAQVPPASLAELHQLRSTNNDRDLAQLRELVSATRSGNLVRASELANQDTSAQDDQAVQALLTKFNQQSEIRVQVNELTVLGTQSADKLKAIGS